MVGDVGCLGLDVADLTDQSYLGDGNAVNGEAAGAGVGFFALDELFDGDWAKGIFCELPVVDVSEGSTWNCYGSMVITLEPPPWLPCWVPPIVKPPPSSPPWAPYVVLEKPP